MDFDANTDLSNARIDDEPGPTTEAGSAEVGSVGEALRERREALGLTHRDLSAITKIQIAHLQYLEEDRYEEFPAEVFARGFLKNYARELRLDADAIVARYDEQTGRAPVVVATPDVEPVESKALTSPINEGRFAHPSTIGRVAYAGALALFILGLALSVLVFGGDDATPSAAYQPADYSEAWQPVPAGENDWQSQREN